MYFNQIKELTLIFFIVIFYSLTNASYANEISFKDGFLTMSIHNMPIEEVLQSIARYNNMKVIVQNGVKGSVSISLSDEPLNSAIRRIVSRFSNTINYVRSENNNSSRVTIITIYPNKSDDSISDITTRTDEDVSNVAVSKKPSDDIVVTSEHQSPTFDLEKGKLSAKNNVKQRRHALKQRYKNQMDEFSQEITKLSISITFQTKQEQRHLLGKIRQLEAERQRLEHFYTTALINWERKR